MVKSSRGIIGVGKKGIEIAQKVVKELEISEKDIKKRKEILKEIQKEIQKEIKKKPLTLSQKVKLKQEKFEKSKFGKIVKQLEKKHNITEYDAIKHARKILTIPKKDRRKIKKIDRDILIQYKT